MYLQLLSFWMLFQTLTSCTTATSSPVAMSNVAMSNEITSNPTEPTNLVFRSTDGGNTWQDFSGGLPSEMGITGLLASEGKVYLASEQGLFSTNSDSISTNWVKESNFEQRIFNVSQGQNGLYANTMTGGIYQELPGTGVWQPIFQDLESPIVHSIYEGMDGSTLVACDAGIYKTSDNGKTIKKVFADGIVRNIAGQNGVLIANGRKGLLRSTDNGDNWEWALTASGYIDYVGTVEGGLVIITQKEAVCDPFAGKKYTYGAQVSVDNGKSWKVISDALPAGSIYDIKQVGNYWFCGHQNGIFRSANSGASWELVRQPRNERNSVILSHTDGVIYAAMFRGC